MNDSSSSELSPSAAALVHALIAHEKLSVLDWARERLANTHRLAAGKTGADRDGWLEDASYWQAIVNELDASARVLAYVQHRPDCPRSLPNLVLDLGPGWTQSVSYAKPCNCGLEAALAAALAPTSEKEQTPQDGLLHQAHQVFFRAGLLACREYLARFVEAESPTIANSIRANWWPALGPDFGPPRKLAFTEVTAGEYGTPTFRVKTAAEVSPTQEALPIALTFLEQPIQPAAALAPHPAPKEE